MLKNKILVTLALVFAYRIGAQITLPGIDHIGLEKAISSGETGKGLLGIFDMFAGGAFSQASILALGLNPQCSFLRAVLSVC